MELHWPHVNSGKHGAAGEGLTVGNSRTVTQILERSPEDDFECTYFRRRTNRNLTTTKKAAGLLPLTISYTSASELSEGYTDSDSESDNTSNVERWLESLPTNDAWSSVPNYSALDGSKGLEGVDEIQEDIKKAADDDDDNDDSGTCANSADDSRKSLTWEREASNVTATGDELAKRTFARRDEMSMAMAEWLDRQAPGKERRRALRTRKKIPLWTKVEQERMNPFGKEKTDVRSPVSTTTPLRGHVDIPEWNISVDKKVSWSNSDTFGGSSVLKDGRMTRKASLEKTGRGETKQGMVNRPLTMSACLEAGSTNDQKVESSSKMTVEASKELCRGNEPKKTDDDSLLWLGSKRRTSSTAFKKLSPKLAKIRINGNKLSKRTRFVQKPSMIKSRSQNPKRPERIAQGKKTSNVKSNAVQKTRYVLKNQSLVMGKKVRPFELPRKVRFQDEVPPQNPSEAWRRTAKVKAARNKEILQTVEQIVGLIKNGGPDCTKENIRVEFGEVKKLPSISSSNKLQLNNAVRFRKSGSWKTNRKRPMFSIENRIIENRKPVFANPLIENCLDKSMQVALKKYKFPQNTWDDFMKEKARENVSSVAYEPPAKKQKPKSFMSKLETVPRTRDFSLLNSWQSIHEYLLPYSTCK